MRILQVIHQFPPFSSQGSEVYCLQLAGALAAGGDDVGVFHLSNTVPRTPRRLVRGVEGALRTFHCVDDGPGVPADMSANLFEPFFSTGVRGTGLGLYMAREFCIVNRAELGHAIRRSGAEERAGFMIRFAARSGAHLDTAGFLDTMPAP